MDFLGIFEVDTFLQQNLPNTLKFYSNYCWFYLPFEIENISGFFVFEVVKNDNILVRNSISFSSPLATSVMGNKFFFGN